MKKQLFFTFFICLTIGFTTAQITFTKIADGDLVNTPSDSRSVNFIDVNQDGWEDIFISNGPSNGQNNMLYLNDGTGNFPTLTNDPITQDNGKSDGATFADMDNDGDLDGYVVTWHGQVNFFYRHEGNSTFTYLQNSILATPGTYSETASWGDYNNDGLVDLFITNSDGNKRNMLFKNLGNSNFEAVETGLLVLEADLSRCVSWTDFDDDGDLDIFITNENNAPNDLFRNEGNDTFSKVTSGTLVESQNSSMSSSWGDVDNDGDLDVFIANAGFFQEQSNQLFRNDGGSFKEVTNTQLPDIQGCSYGSAFADYDNDGDLDLLVANGFCNSNLKDFLLENDGQGNFTKNNTALADLPLLCSFGAAWGDVNNDGFLDLAVAHCKNNTAATQPANSFFLNNANENNWLKIKLQGTLSNQAAIGAKVYVKAIINGQAVWQMREITAQSGYCGQNSLIAHFGLGNAAQVDSIVVKFPSGIENTLDNQLINTQILIVENIVDNVENVVKENLLMLKCYPNPAKEAVQIELTLTEKWYDEPLTLTLSDTLGKVVWEEQIELKGIKTIARKIKRNGLVAGMYFLEGKLKNEVVSQQILFQ